MIISEGQRTGFAPEAMGETTPVLSDGYFYSTSTMNLVRQWAAYSQIYRRQPWVYAIVRKVARAQARLGMWVWDGRGPTKAMVEDSPYLSLLHDPNPWMSGFKLWEWTRSTREIYGEAFWRKIRNGNRVIALWPMHPTRITVKRTPDGEVTYLFDGGAGQANLAALLEMPQDDVVPFTDYNPDSLMRGMSQLEPLNSTLLNEDAARRANSAFWDNGMRPSYVISTDKTLSTGAMNRLKDQVTGMHSGVDNWGKVGIFEEGMKPVPIVLNAEEMQYIGARQLNREECCGVMDIPPPVIHILDHATFSNITEQMRSMYRDTMAPRLADDEAALAKFLAPDFDDEVARFPLDEVLRGDFETKATAIAGLVDHGVMKPSEGRAMIDLPDAGPAADKLYGNANLVPLGETVRNPLADESAGTPVPPVPGQKPAEPGSAPTDKPAPAQAGKDAMRALLGAVGGVKGAQAKRERLVDAHTAAIRKVVKAQRAEVLRYFPAKGMTGFDPRAWDEELADALAVPGDATARYAGTTAARKLGATFSLDTVADWLKKQREATAMAFNDATAADLEDADVDEDPDAIDNAFDVAENDRASILAMGLVTAVLGFVSHDTADKSGAKTKTWVAGPNPRPSHAGMDGETVGIGDTFSNGLRWPGDGSTGDADEVANCDCDLEYGTEAS